MSISSIDFKDGIQAAYAISLLLVERLFSIVKPKLLTLPWFARLWAGFAIRTKAVGIFRSATSLELNDRFSVGSVLAY